jgi:hypothetical protein
MDNDKKDTKRKREHSQEARKKRKKEAEKEKKSSKKKAASAKAKKEKKRARSSSASSSVDSDSSDTEVQNSSSSSEEEGATGTEDDNKKYAHLSKEQQAIEIALDRKFELLNSLWAEEDRPATLKTREHIREHTIDTLMACKTEISKEEAKRGVGAAQYGRDRKLAPKKYEAFVDDNYRKFHPARFNRLPPVEPRKYMKKWETKREPVYRHIPLRHYGIEGQVLESTIVRMHNRGTPVELDMLCREKVMRVLRSFFFILNNECGCIISRNKGKGGKIVTKETAYHYSIYSCSSFSLV